ncbi:hypothetical protein [Metabacillus sp. Hm71]|uniref:hypothetical protein n=1 Tax=Metabacillus sp. Hm71 TaxID=3450743 RepID=UPI003F43EB7D
MKQFFINDFPALIAGIELTEERLTYKSIEFLGNAALLVDDVLISLDIEPHERVILERILHNINDILFYRESLWYYSSFYYFPKSVKGDNLEQDFRRVNNDFLTMRVRIRSSNIGNYSLGDSVDNNFFKRINSGFFRGIKMILDGDSSEFFVPAIYTLLNAIQTLYEYIQSNDVIYQEQALSNLNAFHDYMWNCWNNPIIKEVIKENRKLHLFFLEQRFKYLHFIKKEKLADIEDKLVSLMSCDIKVWNINDKIWGYLNLQSINPSLFVRLFKDDYNLFKEHIQKGQIRSVNHITLLRNVVKSLKETENPKIGEMGIPYPKTTKIPRWFRLQDYFNQYDKIPTINVTEEDMGKLLDFDDDTLRRKIANLMINIDEGIAQKESQKPHGAFEISDMEIPIGKAFEQFYICMPFKSGREFKKLVPEKIAYQIFKPFSYLGDKAIVVFISAAKVSESLDTYVKRMKTLLNWEIHIISHEQLAALLKINNQL